MDPIKIECVELLENGTGTEAFCNAWEVYNFPNTGSFALMAGFLIFIMTIMLITKIFSK